MSIYLSVITLNKNGLNHPVKRHRVVEWIRTHDLLYMLSRRDPSQTKRLHRQNEKCYKNIFQENGQKKNASVAILTSDKIDFKRKAIKRDKVSKGKNPPGNYKHYKHICAQHKSTPIYNKNLGRLQESYR